MLLLPLGLAGTGIAMGRGMEWAEEVHGVLAYAMAGVIVLHILGLAWHTRRHREAIALSMLHGQRRIEASDAIHSVRPMAGVLMALTLVIAANLIVGGLDTQKGTLTLPGLAQPLILKGEEKAEGAGKEHRTKERREDED
jgi:Ca2+/H+ antiporter